MQVTLTSDETVAVNPFAAMGTLAVTIMAPTKSDERFGVYTLTNDGDGYLESPESLPVYSERFEALPVPHKILEYRIGPQHFLNAESFRFTVYTYAIIEDTYDLEEPFSWTENTFTFQFHTNSKILWISSQDSLVYTILVKDYDMTAADPIRESLWKKLEPALTDLTFMGRKLENVSNPWRQKSDDWEVSLGAIRVCVGPTVSGYTAILKFTNKDVTIAPWITGKTLAETLDKVRDTLLSLRADLAIIGTSRFDRVENSELLGDLEGR